MSLSRQKHNITSSTCSIHVQTAKFMDPSREDTY